MKKIISASSLLFLCLSLSSCSWVKMFKNDDGIVRVAVSELPRSLDPAIATTGPQYDLLSVFYETLLETHLQEDGKIAVRPALLAQMPALESDKTFKFQLKEKNFVNEGESEVERIVTSEDVLWSFCRVALRNRSPKIAYELSKVEGMAAWLKLPPAKQKTELPSGFKVLGDVEFSITLSEAIPNWHLVLTQLAYSVVPKEFALEEDLLNHDPIGTTGNVLVEREENVLKVKSADGEVTEFHRVSSADRIQDRKKFDLVEIPMQITEKAKPLAKDTSKIQTSIPFELSFLKVASPEIAQYIDTRLDREAMMKQMNIAGVAKRLFVPHQALADLSKNVAALATPLKAKILLPEEEEAKQFYEVLASLLNSDQFQLEAEFLSHSELRKKEQLNKDEILAVFYLYDSLDGMSYVNWLADSLNLNKPETEKLRKVAETLPSVDGAMQLSQTIEETDKLVSLGGFSRRFLVQPWVSGFEFQMNRAAFKNLELEVNKRKILR